MAIVLYHLNKSESDRLKCHQATKPETTPQRQRITAAFFGNLGEQPTRGINTIVIGSPTYPVESHTPSQASKGTIESIIP